MDNSTKMYDIFLNNQEFAVFVNSVHFKKAEPNEKVLTAMHSPAVYSSYIAKQNNIKKSVVLEQLKPFKSDAFWLKKSPQSLLTFIRYAKLNKLKLSQANLFFTNKYLINSILLYCNLLNKTKLNKNYIARVADLCDENPILALYLLSKKVKKTT